MLRTSGLFRSFQRFVAFNNKGTRETTYTSVFQKSYILKNVCLEKIRTQAKAYTSGTEKPYVLRMCMPLPEVPEPLRRLIVSMTCFQGGLADVAATCYSLQVSKPFFDNLLAEDVLEVKVGAQVMLLKNAVYVEEAASMQVNSSGTPAPARQQARLVNGSRGVVVELIENDVRS